MPDDDFEDETSFWRAQRDGHRSAADVDSMRVEAGVVVCPDCHAGIDADCVNGVSGGLLRFLPCHPKRLSYARKART